VSTNTVEAKPRTAGRHKAPQERPSWILTAAILIIVAYFLLPLWWLMVAATKSNSDLFSSVGLWFARFNLLRNLTDTFTFSNGVFLVWLRNTAVYAIVAGVGSAMLSTAAGYALAKLRFPGREAFFSIILGAIMVPMTALAVPTYLLFARVGFVNTPLAVILPSLVSPFGVYLMRVYSTEAIDRSLMESARVDGANEARIFFSIALRLLAPGFVTVLLFQLVATWNNYFLPLIMLNSPQWYPLTVGLAQWQATGQGGQAQALFSIVITGSFVSILPLIVIFLVLQRYWQSGLAAGSVKQ